MPIFESNLTLTALPSTVFGLLRQTAVLVRLAPPEMHMQVESGPEELALGSQLILRGPRWGMLQRVVSEVTALEPDTLLVLEQRRGPFRRWIHTHRVQTLPGGGTLLAERIDYEPPGGLLGLTVTAPFIERELRELFAHRRRILEEMLVCGAPQNGKGK